MFSTMVVYENESLTSRNLEGNFRSLTWDSEANGWMLVGDHGRLVKLTGGKELKMNTKSAVNLRSISINPVDGTVLIAGNAGTLLQLNSRGDIMKIRLPISENLRFAAWSPNGDSALIAGNNGMLLNYAHGISEAVDGARANLRHISWHPKSGLAIIASNCFAEEFIPSPNLFQYRAGDYGLTPLQEGRNDFIGVDWRPDGLTALIVGYDVVWHIGTIMQYDGESPTPLEFKGKTVYPVRVSWSPTGKLAAIVTSTTQPGMAKGAVLLWDGESIKTVYENPDAFFGSVAWSKDGKSMAALASTRTRTYNC